MTSIGGVIDDDITDVVMIHRCTECGREAATYANCPPPDVRDLSSPQFWRQCVIYGPPAFPSWWFCPHTRFFGITGSTRVRVVQPDDVTAN